ncbi:MAG: universal stress protein [Deltaproteobacteria bacterium]|nr:MAG: universal stress protein [Deltaproteobacteria bacterium]
MVRKILIPVYGSEHSKKAIEFATDVSKNFDSELYLIHVVADKNIPPEILEYIESEKIEGALSKV